MALNPRLTPTRIEPSYGITGDAEGASWPVTEEKLAASRNYWICTVRRDGSPHAKPVWGVWMNDALWFGTGNASVTGLNLARDPRVSIHLESGDDTVIMEGAVEILRGGDVPSTVKRTSNAKYGMPEDSEGPDDAVWYRFTPRFALTWLEASYPTTAARWEFN